MMMLRKYRNEPIEVDGIRFPSKAEARRYVELKILQRIGKIDQLETHPRFKIWGKNGSLICDYIADFQYLELGPDGIGKRTVVEDVKGSKKGGAWGLFRIKAKLFADQFGFEITVVK